MKGKHPPDPESLQCIVLSMTEEEQAEVYEMLADAGFKPDATGMRAFLLACAREDDQDLPRNNGSSVAAILNYLREHPEQTAQAYAAAAKGVDAILYKLKIKTPPR